jgi:hypothetical protein
MRSLRLKGAALPSRPVRPEGDLYDLAAFRPTGGGLLGALGATAMNYHHAGVLGEHGPDFDIKRYPLCLPPVMRIGWALPSIDVTGKGPK